MVRATLAAPKNMKKIIMPERMEPVTLTSAPDLPTLGERWVTCSPAETPPAWVNVSAARAATTDAEGSPVTRRATAPAAAARAPLKSASTWPTTPSTMEPPISAVGFSYSSTWLVAAGSPP